MVAGAAIAFLATGLRIADGWLGYRWLYEFAPGWDGLRTPGRLYTFTSLALALLAAAGAQVVAPGPSGAGRGRDPRRGCCSRS